MILEAVVKWVAGRRVDNYNLQAAYPISYAVGDEVSYKNHYYLIPDLMKIADSKMYQDKAYKKKNQKRRGMSADISVSECVPAHFRDVAGFTRQLLELIGKYQIDSRYLIFEITESAYIHNIDAVNRMIATLHGEQIRISMDDFGSGYSSLNTLKDITFDEVKIDKRFLGDSLTENGRIVLQEIFHLLKRTRKTIVCEGVETRGVADFLIQEGCDELQGYYYYRPMDQESFETVMKEQDRKDRNIVS